LLDPWILYQIYHSLSQRTWTRVGGLPEPTLIFISEVSEIRSYL
jgi:hypothetical protein